MSKSKNRARVPTKKRVATLLRVLPTGDGDLAAARYNMARLAIETDTPCPCCGRYTKIDGQSFNGSMANALVWLSRTSGRANRWVHVPTESPAWVRRDKKLSICARWGLIEKGPKAGQWRMTSLGVDFVQGRAAVKETVFSFDKKVLGLSGRLVYIKDVKGVRFDLEATLARPYDPDPETVP